MKLIPTKIPYALSIVTDDGLQLGMIYFNTQALNDNNEDGKTIFLQWWERNTPLSLPADQRAAFDKWWSEQQITHDITFPGE